MEWKEYQLELLRDSNDNVVIICTIENFDPMGIRTGDSITVALAMTLSDTVFEEMRDMAIRMMRSIGNFARGCNVQFAVDPGNGEHHCHRNQPRGCRAFVGIGIESHGVPDCQNRLKLALGFTLDELKNPITGTSALFEPRWTM